MNPTYPYYGERTVCKEQPIAFPSQHQDRQAGLKNLMNPHNRYTTQPERNVYL